MKLCLFFSYGVSLSDWKRNGSLDREIRYFERLHQQGVQISFFTYGGDDDVACAEAFPWLKVIPLYRGGTAPKSKWARLYASLRAPSKCATELKRSDVYRSNQMLGAWVPALAAHLHRKKFICRIGYEWASTMAKVGRSQIYLWVAHFVSRLVYRAADRIIVTSPRIAEQIQAEYSISESKISILPNFIDTDLFRPASISVQENFVLYVGRLSTEKNLDVLIRACAKAQTALVLIGSGPEESMLRALAQELSAQVKFLGTLSNLEVSKWLSRATIFALISQYEGNPKALLEAMSSGIPIVGSRAPGITDLIQPADRPACGLISEAKAEPLAENLKKLLGDSELRKRLGEAARARAMELCSIDRIVEKEAVLYVG